MNKTVRILTILAVLLSIAQLAAAAIRPGAAVPRAAKGKNLKALDANAWLIKTTNYGPFVFPEGSNSGGFWGGPGYNYIYGAGMWVGALDTLGTAHVSLGYYPNNGGSEFGPVNPYTGEWVNQATDPLARVYLSNNPTDLAEWPLRDSLGQPIVVSVQDGYAAYSDVNPAFTFTGETPVGVRIDQVSYAWNVAQLNDLVFFRTTVKNVTADTLRNVYIGPCFDADIGDESGTNANDRTGFDHARNLAIQFQTDPEPGWPTVGVFGCRYFESPRNNTGDTVHVVDDQYPRSIPPDSQLGMTSFRIFTIDIDPATDSARYVTMQGYDYTTGIMDAFDQTGVNMPGDKRFLMASGPFHLAPGDSAATCVAVMAAHDTLTIRSLSDDAQIIYDNGFATLPITVTSPNGGEVVSGDVAINWTADAPACSLNLYYSADEGMNWTLIADSLPNTGSYSWNTLPLPDGVRYMVSAFIYGNTIFGGDCSDGCFTVNNAAFNAAPEIKLVYPARGSYATGDQHIKYYFGQADGGVCRIDFQLRGTAGTWDSLITVNRAAQLWTRDSLPWNTATVPNYPYYTMRARVNDYLDTVSVVSDTFVVYNYFPHADSIEHASGSSDAVIVNPYVWDQGQLTGHRYEFRFRNIGRGDLVGGVYQPRYKYDLWDTDLNTALLTDRGLSVTMNNAWWWDVPPVIDGFIPEVRYRQNVSTIAVDSGRVTTEAGTISADTLYVTNANTSSAWWMSRGADFEIRWKDTLVTVGGIDRLALTAVVWDMDNNVPVPLDTVSWNNQTRSSWAFGSLSGSPGRSFIDSTTIASRSFLFICGAQLYYNRGGSVARKMTWSTRPTTGEVWTLYTSGSKPPREGDVYSFVGAAGVDGLPGAPCGSFGLSQNAPNPFSGATEFGYQISRPGRVRLRVYNIAGQLVKTLRDEQQGAGFHGVRWDGRNDAGQRLSAGVYLYRLQAGDRTMTRKLVLVK